MRIRRIAILIDGAFFLRRVSKIVGHHRCTTPKEVADWAVTLCKEHVLKLVEESAHPSDERWLDHVYRLFYYDALPYDGTAHHPLENRQIHFDRTPEAIFRHELFRELRTRRKFALRLGKVVREDGWHIANTDTTKRLLRLRDWVHVLEGAIVKAETGEEPVPLTQEQAAKLQKIVTSWQAVTPNDVRLGLRQKGVDMRIGVDISTLTLKKQIDTIILVTGDSDFVPAAKVARREGVEVLLDSLGQSINDDLHEHVDGVVSVLEKSLPNIDTKKPSAAEDEN